MKVRHKETGAIGYSSNFNVCGAGEIIVYYDDGGADSDYAKNYDVFVLGEWKDMCQAFRDKDLVFDDFMIHFRERNS